MTPIKLIRQAIEDAVRQDDQSNPHIRLLTTSERNIASHIRAALESVIRKGGELNGYQVDVEYNRQGEGDDPKKLDGENDSIATAAKKDAFNKDKHKLRLAKSEKHYKHIAFLIFNRNGECFLEIDNDIEYKDS